MSVDLAAIEARLQRLEDREQIWQLLMDYRRHLDQRDYAAYSQLFTENGEWLGNLGSAKGPAAIEALLDRTLPRFPDEASGTYHLMVNPEIEVDGDRATAKSTWCYITRDPADAPVVLLLGHYKDVLTRDGGSWKFLRREAYCDIPYQVLDTSGT